MSTLFDYAFPGSGTLPADLQLVSGPALDNAGYSADESQQTLCRIDTPGSQQPETYVMQGYLTASSGDFEVGTALQPDGSRYAFLVSIGTSLGRMYHVSAANAYTQIGSDVNGVCAVAPGFLRVQASRNGGSIIVSAWNSNAESELGTVLRRTVDAVSFLDTAGPSGGARITAPGRASLLVRYVRMRRATYTDAAAAAPTVSAPSNQTVTAPAPATFSVSITGASSGVQWQVSTDNGGTWANVTDGSGATTTSYTTGATAVGSGTHRNGYQYRAAVAWSGGTVNSAAATLTVNASGTAPSITTQPQPQSVLEGATATFTVVATGTGPLTYQWRKNGTAISGAVAASYTTPTLTLADNGAAYSVVVTGAVSPAATSSNATLTVTSVGTAPSITTQPQAQSVVEGGTATFTVVATGTGPLTYQWRKNGTAISGAVAASYTTPTLTLADNGAAYSVVVTGAVSPAATSSNATLTVTASSGTYSALTDVVAENGLPLANTLLYWTWMPSGRPGSVGTVVNGTGTTNSAGRLTVSHSLAGAGLLLVGRRPGPTVADDRLFAQFLTLA